MFATLDVFVQKYIYSTWAQDARHDILNTTGHDVVKSLDFRAILNDLVAITVADKLPEEKFIERVAILRGLDHTRVDQGVSQLSYNDHIIFEYSLTPCLQPLSV